ncbi:MAG: hypothetical protein M3461_05815 [Pseudomonadota bacterium]|nr:hypothetical protein [Pseudomonadota bacterium]
MLPPLLLYALAVVLFEASGDAEKPFTPQLLAAVQAGRVPGLVQALAELKARLVWFAAALLNIVVPLVAMLYCVVTLRRSVGRGQLFVTAAVGALIGAAILGQLAFGAGQGSVFYQLVFGFTYLTLMHEGGFGDEFLQKVYVIIALINVLATIPPVFILMTTCATVVFLAIEDDPENMAVRARNLKKVIVVASVFMVVGVLHMSVWLAWTSSLVSDPSLQSGLSGVAWSVSAYWGGGVHHSADRNLCAPGPVSEQASACARQRDRSGDDVRGDGAVALGARPFAQAQQLGDPVPEHHCARPCRAVERDHEL